MAEPPVYETALGSSSPTSITLLGQDLAALDQDDYQQELPIRIAS